MIDVLKQVETEDARQYHMDRMGGGCHPMCFPINVSFNVWYYYHQIHAEVISDIHMLCDPSFWEHWVIDWDGQLLEKNEVPGILYNNPRGQEWSPKPINNQRICKLDLLKNHSHYIRQLWFRKNLTGSHVYKVKFHIDYIDYNSLSETLSEVWIIC